MSFVEFLLEYYIFILAVLVVLIVGVIGYLVDSKNKEKKQIFNANVLNNDIATMVPSKVNIANTADVMDVNNNMASVQSNFVNNTMNHPLSVNNDIVGNNVIQGPQLIQPMSSISKGNNGLNLQTRNEYEVSNSLGQINMTNIQNQVQNPGVDSSLVQSLQYQVNENMMGSSGFGNVSNFQNQIGVLQGVQPVNNPILVSDSNSMSNTNEINPRLYNQNQVNTQGPNNIGMSQPVVSDTSLNYGIPVRTIQDTNVVSQNSSNNGLQGNNVVLTTEDSNPFDVSDMFVNNQ